MSKWILVCFMAFAMSFSLKAQQNDTTYYEDYETFDELNFSFGLPSAEFSTVMDRNVFSMGATVSFYAKKHWSLGFYGQRMSSELLCPLNHDTLYFKESRLGYGHIGFEGGYIFFPEKKVHVVPGLRAGWGHISFSDDQTHLNSNGSTIELSKKIETHQLLVISPNLQINYAISPNLKVGFTVGYRKNLGFENQDYSDKDFDGAFASLSILFGNFSYPKFE